MDTNIQFTRKERAMFVYLLKILKNQGDEDYEYDNMIKALQRGFSLHYKDVLDCLYDEDLSEHECQEVLDILEMYRGITYSYKNLLTQGLQGTLTEADIRFKGFDGNNETKQMSYTYYFIQDMNRYDEIDEIAHGYYNSHCPCLSKYQAMLDKWHQMQNKYKMSEQEIKTLLNCY